MEDERVHEGVVEGGKGGNIVRLTFETFVKAKGEGRIGRDGKRGG